MMTQWRAYSRSASVCGTVGGVAAATDMALYWSVLISLVAVAVAGQNTSTCMDLFAHPNCELLPASGLCGRQAPATRVVGGQDASPGQFPWIALLFFKDHSHSHRIKALCGGSAINERYVVSAAHCVDVEDELVSVRLGEHDLAKSRDCSSEGKCAPPPQNIRVESVIMHELFNTLSFHEDICLIRLQSAIKFNEFVYPVCLPYPAMFSNNTHQKETLTVAGWGISKEYRDGRVEYPTVLQTVSLPVVSRSQCQRRYSQTITDRQLCAGGVVGQDSCNGDSGGPLTGIYTRSFLIGIVSYGPSPCGVSQVPGVYTKVSSFIPWILDNMEPW